MSEVNGSVAEETKVEDKPVVKEEPKDETPKKETPKEEAIKVETIIKKETPEGDTPKEEASKEETPKEEKIKVEEKTPKTEPKIEYDPETLAKKIKRQVEYYFGDYNLPTDKFLRTQVKEKDGWVPLETMLKFKRLASLTQDASKILSALANSELIQISEDKTEIRRHPDKPVPEENEARRKEVLTRSAFVKGFPTENFTIDTALDFFEQYSTDDVVMRFYHDKADKIWKFKGSCFIKFPTKEACAAFLALDEVKFGDTVLMKKWHEEYIEEKRQERLDAKLLKRKHPDSDYKNVKHIKHEREERVLPKNATLHMTKIPEGLAREKVKEKVEEMGVTVAYIDYNRGDEEGWIRLHEADTAANVLKVCEGNILKLGEGMEVELRALEGEEETKFLETAQQNISARRNKGKQQHGRGRRGGRGGRGGGRGFGRGAWRKRKHDDDDDEPDSKSFKVEEGSDDD